MKTYRMPLGRITPIYSIVQIFYHRANLVLLFSALLLSGIGVSTIALAQSPIIRAVLFFSPNCGHCHKVINEDLPIFFEQYPDQLQIIGIDVSTSEGQQLYQATIDSYQIPDERLGVPTLVIGDIVLVGSVEIPDVLGDTIEIGLAAGGIDWPEIPGLRDIIDREFQSEVDISEKETLDEPSNELGLGEQVDSMDQDVSNNPLIIDRFKRDILGNSISVIVLLGMVVGVFFTGYVFVKDTTEKQKYWPEWVIPVLALIGLGVAIYLTFVEKTQSEALCGPVGDCNAVQQSPYAILLGIVPIGIIGVIGYVLILGAWSIRRFTSTDKLGNWASLAIWGMAWVGIFFSIYLTFLEPFVIGATCMWCITSAIVMTLILLASTPYAKAALDVDEEEGFANSDPTQV